MKKNLSLLFIFIFTIIFSQKTVSGTVKNSDGESVASASVTVEEPGKDAIIAYAITNSKGEYKISFTSPEPNVDLKVKAFNHKTLVKSIKNESQTLNFTVESQATEIKEVVLKTKIITKKGDTISYDLKSFESKNDRTLADVLKKMPGIEVNTDGTILYQGNAINKFYVNGKDLMEGGYGTVNNSLPKDAVSKVEVMENHQPVKILQDKVASDAAAINIKLKKSVTMTGRGEVGSGFGDPWLWNAKLTPMFFGQKNQWVVNYKTNNTGETVENEGNMLAFGSGWEGVRRQASQNDWLNVESETAPNLPEKRYLMNNVHFLSANLLTNPFKNKEWELKANASYTNNDVERESYTEINYFKLNANYVTNILNHFYTDKAKGELIFTKNAKKGFFKNTTTINQFWNADRADVQRISGLVKRFGAEAIESPTTSFQNSLSAIIPWKQKMVNVKSYLNYQKDHQNLDITPVDYVELPLAFTPNPSFIRQDFQMNSFEANHSANISFIRKNWTFTPEVGLNYKSDKILSDLQGYGSYGNSTLGNNFQNDLKFTKTTPFASLGINYKSESWMLFSNLPLNFNNIKAEDPLRNVSKSLSRITFEPNLFAQYSFASFWKASANVSINQNFGNINNVYSGSILLSPDILNKMDSKNPILEINSQNIGSRIEYRNPLNNLFFNVGYRYNNSKRNLISSPTVDEKGYTVSTFKKMDNRNQTNSIYTEVGKYFPKFKTNASVSYNNSTTKSELMQNNIPINNERNSQNFGIKFNNTYFEWMSIDYNLSWRWTNQNSSQSSSQNNDSKDYNHNLGLFIYPKENHTVGFNWDQVNSSNSSATYRNPFFDLSYQYTWSKKKIDFELKWLNISNRKVFERYTLGDISDKFTRFQLRPSQLMFTVKFNFK